MLGSSPAPWTQVPICTPEGETVSYRRLTRTQKLWVVAAVFWAGALVLTATQWYDPLRSLTQGVAVTLSVLAGTSWFVDRARGGGRVTLPDGAEYVKTYVSSHALLETSPITIEFPRPRIAEPVLATAGRRRSQDYWDAVADVAETLFERRNDDPEL